MQLKDTDRKRISELTPQLQNPESDTVEILEEIDQIKKEYNNITSWIQAGRESGYSWCCITWYCLRCFIHKLTNIYIYFHPVKADHWTRHILCPLCVLKYFILGCRATYYRCPECLSHQFQNPICISCSNKGSTVICQIDRDNKDYVN